MQLPPSHTRFLCGSSPYIFNPKSQNFWLSVFNVLSQPGWWSHLYNLECVSKILALVLSEIPSHYSKTSNIINAFISRWLQWWQRGFTLSWLTHLDAKQFTTHCHEHACTHTCKLGMFFLKYWYWFWSKIPSHYSKTSNTINAFMSRWHKWWQASFYDHQG